MRACGVSGLMPRWVQAIAFYYQLKGATIPVRLCTGSTGWGAGGITSERGTHHVFVVVGRVGGCGGWR